MVNADDVADADADDVDDALLNSRKVMYSS